MTTAIETKPAALTTPAAKTALATKPKATFSVIPPAPIALTIDDCLKPGAGQQTIDALLAAWNKDEAVAAKSAADELTKAITGGNTVQYQFWEGPYDLVYRVEVDTATSAADKRRLRAGVDANLTSRNLTVQKGKSFAHRVGKAVMGRAPAGKDRERLSVSSIGLNEVATIHKVPPKDFVSFMQKNGWQKLRKEASDRNKKNSGVVDTWPQQLEKLRDVLAARSEEVIDVPASTTASFGQHDEGKRALLIVTYKDGKLVINGVTKPDSTLLERAVVAWALQHKDHDFNATLPPTADQQGA